jgi:hypothetical protein
MHSSIVTHFRAKQRADASNELAGLEALAEGEIAQKLKQLIGLLNSTQDEFIKARTCTCTL